METEQELVEFTEEQATDGLEQEQSEIAEVEEQEQATTPSGEEGATGEEPEEPKKRSRYQERIDALVREREEAREEMAAWREEVMRRDREQHREKPPEIQVDMSDYPKPKRDDFEDEDDFQATLSEWAATKAYRTERARERQQEEMRLQSEHVSRLETWQKAGRDKYPDFDAVALRQPNQGGPLITDAMVEAIMQSDFGHEVAYFLGQNPQESYRIANMMPVAQRMEIRNLARRESTRKKPKTESTAPTPTAPVGDREVVKKPVDLYDPNISFKDYQRIRMKQLYGDDWGR